jgi:hypothetical protein
MATIERYTKGIVKDRAVADLTDPSAIDKAGSTARGIADATATGAAILDKFVEAQEVVAVNEAIIKNKKQKMEFLDAKRQENMADPLNFHKRIEPDLAKIDAEMEAALPTGRAKSAFKERTQQINLAAYDDNFQWAKSRQVEMFAESVDTSTQELGVMAYRAGERGGSIDDILRDAEATAVAGSTIVAPEKVEGMSRKIKQTVVENYINAVAERNPHQAKKILASGKYDGVLDGAYLRGQNIYADNKIKQLQAEQDRAKLTQQLLDVANSQAIADPGNKDHRDAINQSFIQSGLAAAFSQGDQAASQGLLDIYQKTSIIPDAAQSTLRGYMMNGTTEQKATAYTLIGKMQETNPAALAGPGGFAEKEIKEASIYNQLIRSGADPDFALTSIAESNNPLTADVRQMRQEQLSGMKDKQKTLRDLAVSQVNERQGQSASWFNFIGSGVPDLMEGAASDSIMSKYETIFDQEFMRTGSQESAAAAAASVLDRYAGTTKVRGKAEIMEFPPEKYYGAPGLTLEENSEWIKGELEQSIKQVDPKISVDDVFLVPAPESRNLVDNGKKPKYYVWRKVNDYGGMDTLRGEDNLPALVDFTPEIGAKKAEQKKAVSALKQGDYKADPLVMSPLDWWLRESVIKNDVLKSQADKAADIVDEVKKKRGR